MKAIFRNVPSNLRKRAWYEEGSAYVYLVDQPITFGHSQLCVSVNNLDEEDVFAFAAIHVVQCIKVFRTKLSILNLEQWSSLSNYTGTSGEYQKTLLLKASAQESKNEYKIHLVPYFSSHLKATTNLYRAMQEIDSDETGGLLHWIGQRERIVDYDLRNGREENIAKKRITSFRLPALALVLRD